MLFSNLNLFYLVLIISSISCNNTHINDGCIEDDNFVVPEIQQEIILLDVLFSKTKDSVFIFNIESNANCYKRLDVSYLGEISTRQNKKLDFILSNYYLGMDSMSLRGNSKLHIYDVEKGKIGFYCFGSIDSAPSRLLGNKLIFEYDNEYCNEITSISFEDSIPTEIFVLCSTELGDIYSFQKFVYNFDDFSFLKQYLLKK